MSYVDGEGRETQRVIWPIQLSFMMSKPAEIEQMAMSISAWSWIVEWRLILKRSAGTPAYVVFICREIVEQGELKTYWQRVSETLVSHKARVLMDHGRFLILEGRG